MLYSLERTKYNKLAKLRRHASRVSRLVSKKFGPNSPTPVTSHHIGQLVYLLVGHHVQVHVSQERKKLSVVMSATMPSAMSATMPATMCNNMSAKKDNKKIFWTISTKNQWEISEVGRLSCFIGFQIMLISLFPRPFDHFHFHGSGGLILWYDLRLWLMKVRLTQFLGIPPKFSGGDASTRKYSSDVCRCDFDLLKWNFASGHSLRYLSSLSLFLESLPFGDSWDFPSVNP